MLSETSINTVHRNIVSFQKVEAHEISKVAFLDKQSKNQPAHWEKIANFEGEKRVKIYVNFSLLKRFLPFYSPNQEK